MMVCFLLLAQVQVQDSPPALYPQYEPNFWLLVVQWLLPFTFGVAFYVLLAVCIYKAAKFFGNAGREQKLLRIEMGKLAEEVHFLRQELKGDKHSNP